MSLGGVMPDYIQMTSIIINRAQYGNNIFTGEENPSYYRYSTQTGKPALVYIYVSSRNYDYLTVGQNSWINSGGVSRCIKN